MHVNLKSKGNSLQRHPHAFDHGQRARLVANGKLWRAMNGRSYKKVYGRKPRRQREQEVRA